MAKTLTLVAAACAPALGTPSTPASASDGTTVHQIGAGLSGTDDLAATVVATGLPNVAALAVDGRGRVWASTAAYSDAGTDAIYLVDAATTTRVIAGTIYRVARG